MSSFINKSGKKVAPKGAPRRRAGGPPAATPASVQPSVESTKETPQPNEAANPDINAQLPTPNATQIEKLATPAPVVTVDAPIGTPYEVPASNITENQSSSRQQSGSRISDEAHAVEDSITGANLESQRSTAAPLLAVAPSTTRHRSASPLDAADGSRAAKRRRVTEVVNEDQTPDAGLDVISNAADPIETTRSVVPTAVMVPVAVMQSAAPSIAALASLQRNNDDAEAVGPQFVKGRPRGRSPKTASVFSPNGPPVIHTSSRARQSNSPRTESLVPYETPAVGASGETQTSSTGHPSATENSVISTDATSPSIAKSRAKGARKDQWQVSTPTDVTTAKGKRNPRKPVDRMQIEARPEANDGDDHALPSIVTLAPKPRKVRKDKGVKKTPKTSQAETSKGPVELANSAGPENEPPVTGTSATGPEVEPSDSAASKRLANAQKRKAKQLAKTSALSKAVGRANAALIDDAVAQTIEGRGRSRGSSSRAKNTPTFIVTPGSGDDEPDGRPVQRACTELTEGGTAVRNPRPRRASTPEENESVFIVESKTSMWDLTGRDTENRVGAKSEREKAMRQIDWAEVKVKRKAEEERMARMARNKRQREDDYDPEEEGLDEDEKLRRAVAKNKNRRPGLQINLVNGEHVIDEQSQMIDRQRLNEEELELLEEVEEDDLTKKFNVHTYGTWRRKEEDERVMVNEKWSWEQTEKFYEALASFGTDFMIISKLFPGKTRRHIKSKFVREERAEPERVRDALTGHNSGRRREGGGWDLDVFRKGAGLAADAFLDPKKIEEELKRERVEREKEIEEARAEAQEEERQRKLAGALNGDDDLGSDGEPLSPGGVVRAAQAAAREKKLNRMGEKKRKMLEMAGGTEEVIESIEDD